MFKFTYNDTVADPVQTADMSMNITWNSRGFDDIFLNFELWNGTYDSNDVLITSLAQNISAANGIYEVESLPSFIRNGSHYYIKATVASVDADILYSEALNNGTQFTIEGRE